VIIFPWESAIYETARSWPTEGPVFEFFKFWTDYRESAFLVIPIILFLMFKLGTKKVAKPLSLASLSVILGDLISRRVIKSFFMRPRPHFINMECHLSKCWGFVSSHSTNITAACVFLCLYDRRNTFWALPVTILVCFSRIYLNDHFFLDVLGGAVLGSFVGWIVWFFYQQIHLRKLDSAARSLERNI
jgi:undecaprenyl-diphosphatase